jgi:hypothetical protein
MLSSAALLFALAGSSAAAGADRFALLRLELVGPLERVRVDVGRSASFELEGAVSAGERWSIEAPLALSGTAERAVEPELRLSGAGNARVVGWDENSAAARSAAWGSTPIALRSRPPLGLPAREGPRAPFAAVALASSGALLALALRRRLWPAALVSASSVAGAVALVLLQPAPAAGLTVVEVDGRSARAVLVELARDELHDARVDDLLWSTLPASAPVTVRAARGSASVRLVSPGAVLRATRAFQLDARRLAAEHNEWGLLSPVWRRSADGDWEFMDTWPAGTAWAGISQDAPPPPGWLQPGLPLGVTVLLGRWESAEPSGAAPTWVRWIGE